MEFNFITPSLSEEEVKEVVAKSGPRQVAPAGTYRVKLHSLRGRNYVKDGDTRELASLFFTNLDGNYKGAELTLFRVAGNPASTTSKEAVIAIGLAAGLSSDQISTLNWAINPEAPVDDRGNVAAAFGTPEMGAISIDGLEFKAKIEVETGANGYQKNVIKSLRVLS